MCRKPLLKTKNLITPIIIGSTPAAYNSGGLCSRGGGRDRCRRGGGSCGQQAGGSARDEKDGKHQITHDDLTGMEGPKNRLKASIKIGNKSQLVELLPFLAGWLAGEEVVGGLVVGDLLGSAVELELGVESLGNHAQRHHLAQWAGDGKGGSGFFLAHRSEQKVLVVV